MFFLFFFRYQTELADALRKRNGRSDISEEDPETSHFPSIHARNASHMAIDRNIHGYKRDNHQGSLDLLDMVTPEEYATSEDQSDKSMYDSDRKNGSDEIFPPEISHDSAIKLSHSAAKHKMAIRPKKKGPTRLTRKPNEVCFFVFFSPFFIILHWVCFSFRFE